MPFCREQALGSWHGFNCSEIQGGFQEGKGIAQSTNDTVSLHNPEENLHIVLFAGLSVESCQSLPGKVQSIQTLECLL